MAVYCFSIHMSWGQVLVLREDAQSRKSYMEGMNNTLNGRGGVRTFGGHIMNRGGVLRLTGCKSTHRLSPP